jgi:hypothetical protein
MVATVSKSQQQAQLLTFCLNPPITLLSGATSPIENMREFFQQLSYLDPLRYLVTIVRSVTFERRAVERTVVEPSHLFNVRHRSVLDQRVAVPQAMTGTIQDRPRERL